MLLVAKPAYTVSASGTARLSWPLESTAHAIRATLCAVATINNVPWRPRLKRTHPRAHRDSVSLRSQHDRACSMNQDLAQVRVAAFADSIQSHLATGRMLVRQQPQPGRELPPLAEGCAVTDGGNDRGCNQRSDARDLPQSPTRRIARSDPLHLVVHLDDLKLQVLLLAPQHGNQVPHPRGEVLVDVLKHLGQSFPQPNRTSLSGQSPVSRFAGITGLTSG